MEILLDTHILLWTLNGDTKLSDKAKKIIFSDNNTIYYSIVSIWEIAIKHKAKPHSMGTSGTELFHYCEQAGFKELVLNEKHIIALETIEKIEETPPHNDPFDKILLAQAKGDGMLLLTHDKCFSYYDEPYYRIV